MNAKNTSIRSFKEGTPEYVLQLNEVATSKEPGIQKLGNRLKSSSLENSIAYNPLSDYLATHTNDKGVTEHFFAIDRQERTSIYTHPEISCFTDKALSSAIVPLRLAKNTHKEKVLSSRKKVNEFETYSLWVSTCTYFTGSRFNAIQGKDGKIEYKTDLKATQEGCGQKTSVLVFDRDIPEESFRGLSFDEKVDYLKAEIAIAIPALCDVLKAKPYLIQISSGGYHVKFVLSRWIGWSETTLQSMSLSTDERMAAGFKEFMYHNGVRKFVNSKLTQEEELELSKSDDMPLKLTQEAISGVVYKVALKAVDDAMGCSGYFDKQCGSIGRMSPDSYFYNTKKYDNPCLIQEAYEELCDKSDFISRDKLLIDNKYLTIDFMKQAVSKYVLQGQELIGLDEQQPKHNWLKRAIFTDRKSKEQIEWIKREAVKKLRCHPYFIAILTKKLDVPRDIWMALGSSIAPLAMESGEAYELWRELSQVNHWLVKPSNDMLSTWSYLVERASQNQYDAPSQKVIRDLAHIPHAKEIYKEGLSMFKSGGLISNASQSPLKEVLYSLKKDYLNTFDSDLIDNPREEQQEEMGLYLLEDGELNPFYYEENLAILIAKDNVFTRIFRYDTFFKRLVCHKDLVKNKCYHYKINTDSRAPSIEKQLFAMLKSENGFDMIIRGEDGDSLYPSTIWNNLSTHLKQKWGLNAKAAIIEEQTHKIFRTHPNEEMVINTIVSSLEDRKQEYLASDRRDYLSTWLPDSLYINKDTSPTIYKRYGMYGRKLVLGHINRALCTYVNGTSPTQFAFLLASNVRNCGKSTVPSIIINALFGNKHSIGSDYSLLERDISWSYTTTTDFMSLSGQRTVMQTSGYLANIYEETDKNLNKAESYSTFKSFITQDRGLGVGSYQKSESSTPFQFIVYGSTNEPETLIHATEEEDRRLFIVNFDLIDETNPNKYACKFIDKNNSDGGVLDDSVTKHREGNIDLNLLSDLVSLAFGQGYHEFTGGLEENTERLALLKKQRRTRTVNLIVNGRIDSERTTQVEDLSLTKEEKHLVIEANKSATRKDALGINASFILEEALRMADTTVFGTDAVNIVKTLNPTIKPFDMTKVISVGEKTGLEHVDDKGNTTTYRLQKEPSKTRFSGSFWKMQCNDMPRTNAYVLVNAATGERVKNNPFFSQDYLSAQAKIRKGDISEVLTSSFHSRPDSDSGMSLNILDDINK